MTYKRNIINIGILSLMLGATIFLNQFLLFSQPDDGTIGVSEGEISQENNNANHIVDTKSSSQTSMITAGSSFASATTVLPDNMVSDTFTGADFHYYRYYAEFPYNYVNITLEGEADFNIRLYDQFSPSISSPFISSTGSSFTKTITISISSSSSLKSDIRFIGWYYIELESFTTGTYNITVEFLDNLGASLWNAEEVNTGTSTWASPFIELENSGQRNSRFFKFNVINAGELISYQLSGPNDINSWLYGPDLNFLLFNDTIGEWLATEAGFYYLEISASTSTALTGILSISSTSITLGDSLFQPKEIARDSTLIDPISSSTSRFVQLYLFQGENATITIQDTGSHTNNFDAFVTGPWGFWYEANQTPNGELITINNVNNTGYYIFQVFQSGGSAQSEYEIINLVSGQNSPASKSWQAATMLPLISSLETSDSLSINDEFWYQTNINQGDNLSVVLDGPNGGENFDLEIYGKHRNLIANSVAATADEQLALNNISQSGILYFKIYSLSGSGPFTLNLTKQATFITNNLHIEGKLEFQDTTKAANFALPLISVYLFDADNGSADDLLMKSSTNSDGTFQFTIIDDLDPDGSFFVPYLLILFEGPGVKVHSMTDFNILHSVTIDLASQISGSGIFDVGTVLVPSSPTDFREIANIYHAVTTGWLWIENRTATAYGPSQITVHYSFGVCTPNSCTVSYYQPDEYTIYLLGGSGDDDGWDDSVILHEYGHHVQQIYDIENNPAGSHTFSTTISADFAHGEGWPSFFASMVFDDEIYADSPFAPFNLETGLYLGKIQDLFGEWGETSVQALYWDLFDSNDDDINGDGIGDHVSLDPDILWKAFATYRTTEGHGVWNLADFYEALLFFGSIDEEAVASVFFEHGASAIASPQLGDSFQTGFWIDIGSFTNSISNQSIFYRFKSSSFTAIEFSLQGPTNSTNFDLYFYNSTFDIIAQSTNSNNQELIYFAFDSSVVWYFEVVQVGGTGNFTLTVSDGPAGSSLTNPIILSSPDGIFSLPGNAPDNSSYWKFSVSAGIYDVILELTGITTVIYGIFFTDGTEIISDSITGSGGMFSLILNSSSNIIFRLNAPSADSGTVTASWEFIAPPSTTTPSTSGTSSTVGTQSSTASEGFTSNSPGFEIIISLMSLMLLGLILKKRKNNS